MIEMGAMCEEAIASAAKALRTGDIELAGKVKANGSYIDQMERDIESRCMKLLLHQQPVARDLRQISAALKMITDMERIGDQAEDIAEIVPHLNGHAAAECNQIRSMAKETIRMVTDSVDAYVKHDVDLARSVLSYDDIVDNYFDSVKKTLIEMVAQNPEDGEYALDLLMITKYFERIGDHATNIAEWVIFSITGLHKGETV
ncbi:MAG: phosphate signaling complex protein PhoU [Oscillospiraceae bacterium]|nr:phosphate signaling complex protein PhoU [Oscillospiraceae bacterium]